MNRTNFEHALFALLMLAVIGWPTGNWWAGAAFGSAFFLGREHAQREYHLGDPSKLPPWAGFDIWNWSLDAKLDLIVPVIVVGLAAYVLAPL